MGRIEDEDEDEDEDERRGGLTEGAGGMANASETILFHVGFQAQGIDLQNKVIRGVSLITGDLEAEGHGLHVDDTTLKQIHEWAVRNKKVTVKCDHKGPDGKTFKAIVGYLENFSLDLGSKKVRGDLHLLHEDPETPKILEMAERMPGNFGLSVAFKGKGEKGKGKIELARCEKLLSTDLVETPAANPDGLFSVPVDSGGNRMADATNEPTQTENEPTLKDVLAAVQQLNQMVQQQQQTIDQMMEKAAANQGPLSPEELDALNGMTDAQLAEHGLTRADVEAAVAAANEMGDGEGESQPGAHASAPAGVPAGPVGAALSAVQKEVATLKRQRQQDIAFAQRAEEEHAFSVIEAKVTALAAENDDLVTQLAAKDVENKALRATLKTGARGVAPGVETLFTAKEGEGTHEFAALVQKHKGAGKTDAEALRFSINENPAAHRDWLQKQAHQGE